MNLLRTKNITIGDKTITLKELSIAGQYRLQGKNFSFEELLKECLNPEDYEWYNDNKEELPRWVTGELDVAWNEINERPSHLPSLKKVVSGESFRTTTT